MFLSSLGGHSAVFHWKSMNLINSCIVFYFTDRHNASTSLQCRRLVGVIELALSLRPPLDAMLDGGEWGRGKMRRFAPPPPLFLLLPIAHPRGRTFFLSSVFPCMKNSIWRLNFLRCERSLEEISPALQAMPVLVSSTRVEHAL